MQEQTNMEKVKDIAKMFLYMDVGKTKHSPIVIKHPFADSGITMVRKETGDFEMVNLMKEEDLDKWRSYVEKKYYGSRNGVSFVHDDNKAVCIGILGSYFRVSV